MSNRLSDSPQKWLNDQVETIRHRKDLSEQGKLAHIARSYEKAREHANAARNEAADTWEATRQSLLRPLMAPRQWTAEWRQVLADVQSSVKSPSQALKELDEARVLGDGMRLQAIGATALDHTLGDHTEAATAWGQVVERWGSADANAADHLTALDTHYAERPNTAERMVNNAVSEPPELRSTPGWRRLIPLADDPDEADLTTRARRDNEFERGLARLHQRNAGQAGVPLPGRTA
jgi:hypothetical protein